MVRGISRGNGLDRGGRCLRGCPRARVRRGTKESQGFGPWRARRARPPRYSPLTPGHPSQARRTAHQPSPLGPSKSRCHQSDVQSRRRQLGTFSPDWCVVGSRGGIRDHARLSGVRGRWWVPRAVPTVLTAGWGQGRGHDSVMAPRAVPPSLCRHLPHAEMLAFQS